MNRFRAPKKRTVPALNTAALPDLIFTLLFFFLLVTHMRPFPELTQLEIPQASELQHLHDKSQLIYLMAGKNKNQETIVQLNASLVDLEEISTALTDLKNKVEPEEQSKITVILKIDKNTPMATVEKIRQSLKQAGLLTVYYSVE